jgi:hypothetical protein
MMSSLYVVVLRDGSSVTPSAKCLKQRETQTLETLVRGESDAFAFLTTLREGSHEAACHR